MIVGLLDRGTVLVIEGADAGNAFYLSSRIFKLRGLPSTANFRDDRHYDD